MLDKVAGGGRINWLFNSKKSYPQTSTIQNDYGYYSHN